MRSLVLLPMASALLASAAPVTERLVPRTQDLPPVSTQCNGSSKDTCSTTGRSNPIYTEDQLSAIKLKLSAAERYKSILDLGDPDTYFKYDYSKEANANAATSVGPGGQIDLADVEKWPALLGADVAASVGFLNPCGFNTPHSHNRATEIITIVQGNNVLNSFVLETGLTTPITTTLNQYQGAVLPVGSIHFQFNDSCDPAVFVSSFSHENPGISRTVQNFFAAAPDIVQASLGWPQSLDNTNIANFRDHLPKAVALGLQQCFVRCNIPYSSPEQ